MWFFMLEFQCVYVLRSLSLAKLISIHCNVIEIYYITQHVVNATT